MYHPLILFVVIGFLLILFSIPFIFNKIKIHNFYGERVPSSIKKNAIWYDVNRKGGLLLFFFGNLIIVFSSAFIFFEFINLSISFLLMTLIIIFGTIYILLRTISFAEELVENKNIVE